MGEDGISLVSCPGKANVMVKVDFYDVDPEREHLFNVMVIDPQERMHGGWTDQVISLPEGEISATALIVQEGMQFSEPGKHRFVVIEGELKQGYGTYQPLYVKDILVTSIEQSQQHRHFH